jgi:hypothetical protein
MVHFHRHHLDQRSLRRSVTVCLDWTVLIDGWLYIHAVTYNAQVFAVSADPCVSSRVSGSLVKEEVRYLLLEVPLSAKLAWAVTCVAHVGRVSSFYLLSTSPCWDDSVLHLELSLVVDIYRSLKVNMDDDWQPTQLYCNCWGATTNHQDRTYLPTDTYQLIDRQYTSHDLLPTFLNLTFPLNLLSSFLLLVNFIIIVCLPACAFPFSHDMTPLTPLSPFSETAP